MSTRTVRLDDEAEATLAKLQERTGQTISELLQAGLVALDEMTRTKAPRRAYDIWKELDLGPGGYAVAPAREAKTAIREILLQKHLGRKKEK